MNIVSLSSTYFLSTQAHYKIITEYMSQVLYNHDIPTNLHYPGVCYVHGRVDF